MLFLHSNGLGLATYVHLGLILSVRLHNYVLVSRGMESSQTLPEQNQFKEAGNYNPGSIKLNLGHRVTYICLQPLST